MKTYDPAVFAGVALLLSAIALLAALVPAHRATQINPLDAVEDLRIECRLQLAVAVSSVTSLVQRIRRTPPPTEPHSTATGPTLSEARRRRALLRRLLERVGQLQQLRLAAGRTGEADAEGLRLRIESRRKRQPAAGGALVARGRRSSARSASPAARRRRRRASWPRACAGEPRARRRRRHRRRRRNCRRVRNHAERHEHRRIAGLRGDAGAAGPGNSSASRLFAFIAASMPLVP